MGGSTEPRYRNIPPHQASIKSEVFMLKSLAFVSLLATAAAATAQSADTTAAPEQAPAPIVRSYQSSPAPQADPSQDPNGPGGPPPYSNGAPMRRSRRPGLNSPDTRPHIIDTQPISGVWLRSTSATTYKTISATPQRAEIRLEHGILNVNVHQPAQHSEILVDLPGGQASLLKDGLYTFNGDTSTIRVLHGEAAAFPGPAGTSEKDIKVKESHQLAFTPAPPAPGSNATTAPTAGFRPKSVEAYPYELAADLLPADSSDGNAYANASGPGYGYGYGDDGPYGYPYYAGPFGYPYGYGYPYGLYPYVGFGYGYYGGFHGGYYGGRGFGGGRGFRR